MRPPAETVLAVRGGLNSAFTVSDFPGVSADWSRLAPRGCRQIDSPAGLEIDPAVRIPSAPFYQGVCLSGEGNGARGCPGSALWTANSSDLLGPFRRRDLVVPPPTLVVGSTYASGARERNPDQLSMVEEEPETHDRMATTGAEDRARPYRVGDPTLTSGSKSKTRRAAGPAHRGRRLLAQMWA